MDRGAWWATVHRVAESRTWLSEEQHDSPGVLLGRYSFEIMPPKAFPCGRSCERLPGLLGGSSFAKNLCEIFNHLSRCLYTLGFGIWCWLIGKVYEGAWLSFSLLNSTVPHIVITFFFEESIMTAVGNMWRWLRDSLLLFSRYILSNSLWPHRLQYARLPCPSRSPRVCSNSCPLSQWCSPTFSFSVVPFSFCPLYFPAPGSFPMSLLFKSSGESIGTSAWVLRMNI